MILQTLTIQHDTWVSLCAVSISENSGGKIALLIIVSALILLAVANWGWKKYFANKKEISTQK